MKEDLNLKLHEQASPLFKSVLTLFLHTQRAKIRKPVATEGGGSSPLPLLPEQSSRAAQKTRISGVCVALPRWAGLLFHDNKLDTSHQHKAFLHEKEARYGKRFCGRIRGMCDKY